MPYTPVQPIDLVGNFFAGQQAAQQSQANQQINALRGQQIQRGQNLNALSQNPNATPTDYIRAGDVQTGAALQGVQDKQTGDDDQTRGVLGALAKKALTITDPQQRRAALIQDVQALAPHLGPEKTQQALADLQKISDEEITQRAQQFAQFAPADKPITVAAGGTVGTADASGKFTPSYTAPNPGQEETARHNRAMEGISQQRISSSPESLITPQGLEIAAQQYYADGTLPKGLGRGSAAMNAKVINRAAEIAAENGDDAQAAILKRNAFTATRKAQADTLKQFSSGKNGNTVRSLNVAVQHLDQLSELGVALQNGNLPLLNKLGNAWAQQTGQAAPTSFNAMKKIVADELVKAVVGSGGGVADREEASKSIDAAQSPQQMAEVIQNYKGLMAGQLNGLRQQYKEGSGRDDFERFLLPGTRAELENHTAASAQQPAQADSVPTATGPNGQKLYLRNGQWVPK